MPKADGVSRLAATVLVVVLSSAIGRVQEPARVLSIAADSIDEIRQWDPVVNRLTSARALAVRTVYDDPQVPGRRHEGLVQYYSGLPVYGGDLTRQTDRGVTVSIFGTIYEGIDVNPAPRLTADDARQTLEKSVRQRHSAAGGSLVDDSADGGREICARVSRIDAQCHHVFSRCP